ncbi:subtilase-type protease inhibitor [Streptomyces sp. NPDC093252]|uniref:subtilase-type protease inhibitor n=1 Tax=Streptomyces sp. NPDC093252 TaxID=3154980 RepID=UPI0034183013
MRNTARWAATLGLTVTAAIGGPFTGAALAAPAAIPVATPAVAPAATLPAAPAATLAVAPVATPATPTSLYAPTALVLTVARGEAAGATAPERAVTLSCAPAPGGTHPSPRAACAELTRVGGDFDTLTADAAVMCTRDYRPVVATVSGVWQGKRVGYERTFPNDCMMRAHGAGVFSF